MLLNSKPMMIPLADSQLLSRKCKNMLIICAGGVHIAWMKAVAERLNTGYKYLAALVYNYLYA